MTDILLATWSDACYHHSSIPMSPFKFTCYLPRHHSLYLVLSVEPDQQFIHEPLQTRVRLTCNAIQNDTVDIEWQVQIGGVGGTTSSTGVLRRNNIILSEFSTISRSIEITGTQRNSGSVCMCVVTVTETVPGQTDGTVPCISEFITVVFYGTCVSHT